MDYAKEAYPRVSRWLDRIVQPAVRDAGEDLGGWQEFSQMTGGVAFTSEVSRVSAHTRLWVQPRPWGDKEKEKVEFDSRKAWIESGFILGPRAS